MPKAKKTTKTTKKKKDTVKKEEINLRVEDYLAMGDDVEILSVDDQIEEKFSELVPVLEKRLKEHTKFLIDKDRHVQELDNPAEISETKAEIKLTTQDRFKSIIFHCFYKINSTTNCAMVCQGTSCGTYLFDTRCNLRSL